MAPPPADVLVIGFGSDLRGDDAAGRRVADAVGALGLPGVRVLSVHQLVPELAADLAASRRAVFVDATVDGERVDVRRVGPASGGRPMTHRFDPPALLSLAGRIGPVPEEARVVTVPARDLRLGAALSPTASAAVREAVDRVAELCRGAAARPGTAGGAGQNQLTAGPEVVR